MKIREKIKIVQAPSGEMNGEVCKALVPVVLEDGREGYVITADHSVADIMRFCVEQSDMETVQFLADNINKNFISLLEEERNTALCNLDISYVERIFPEGNPDSWLLTLHKTRYEIPEIPTELRHESGEFLRQHNCTRANGKDLLPEGELPTQILGEQNDG